MSKIENVSSPKERLMSLDVLRGLDMIYLMVSVSVMRPLMKLCGASEGTVSFWTKHPWEGFSAYDIIMPMFIFMCGAAIPFALGKRMDGDGRPAKGFWRHVWSRFVLLWILGMAAQGGLLSYEPAKMFYFSNTLQTIAIGYVITAAVMLIRRRWVHYAVTAALAAGYGIAMAVWGDYGEHTNLAAVVEHHIACLIYPAGNAMTKSTTTYTWFATIPMFGFMSLCGFHATNIIRSAADKWRKVAVLGGFGLAMLVIGLVAEWCGVPCIKHVFSFSFTLQAMGWCVLMLDALYVIIDVLGFRRGWWLTVLFGQVSLAAYMMGGTFNVALKAFSERLVGGLAAKFPDDVKALILGLATFATLSYVLFVWRRFKQASKLR